MRKFIAPDVNHKPIQAFVATNKTQGQRASDFCYVKEGDLVWTSFVCDRDIHDADGPCGCGRSMVSIESGTNTTTFMAAMINMSENEYVTKFSKRLKATWDLSFDEAKQIAIENLETAACFSVGYVLEKRCDTIQTRADPGSTAA